MEKATAGDDREETGRALLWRAPCKAGWRGRSPEPWQLVANSFHPEPSLIERHKVKDASSLKKKYVMGMPSAASLAKSLLELKKC